MIVGYARVSSDDQKLDLQTDALRKERCEKIYSDNITGSKKERPGLDQALETLREGDTFIVWRLDRLSRSLRDLISLVCDLRDRGIIFKSIKESIETSTPTGQLTFHIFGAIAEFERVLIRERTMEGLRSARARGRMGGAKFKLDKAQIKLLISMYESREHSISTICKFFKLSIPTIYNYLHRNNIKVNE